MILLYPTKFRVNPIIIRRDIAKSRFSIWRPSAILTLQNFGILLNTLETQSASTYQILLKSDDFRLRYSDKTIFKMEAVRHLEFSKFGILVICSVLERDSDLSYKILR